MQKKKHLDLTRGEEQIMQILWQLGEGNVNEIISHMEEPKPAYTTVATFMKILEDKAFVSRKLGGGRSFTYRPTVRKTDYAQRVLQATLAGYFNGSFVQLVSFFTQHEKLKQSEIDELDQIIEEAKATEQAQ